MDTQTIDAPLITSRELVLAILQHADQPLMLAEILHTPRAVAHKLTKEDTVNRLRELIEAGACRQFTPFEVYNHKTGAARPWWSYRLWNLSKLDNTGGQFEMPALADENSGARIQEPEVSAA